MLVGTEGIVRSEQYRDLEREADRERLIRQTQGVKRKGTPSARGTVALRLQIGIAAILGGGQRARSADPKKRMAL
jgi:hypothetical protein